MLLINLPLGIIAVLLTLRLASATRGEPWTFDTAASACSIAFIVPVLLALEQAQRMSADSLPTSWL